MSSDRRCRRCGVELKENQAELCLPCKVNDMERRYRKPTAWDAIGDAALWVRRKLRRR